MTELNKDIRKEPASFAESSGQASTSIANHQVKIYNPIESSSIHQETDLSETFFEPTLSDVRSHHASIVQRNKQLNEAPLLTVKYREEERERKERIKKEKWPETTVRIKFSDGTIVQSVFSSSARIQPVYAFVRSCLSDEAQSKPFVLWQPPRTKYPEHPPAKANLKSSQRNAYRTTIIPSANYGAIRGGPVQGLQGGTGGQETLGDLGLVPQSVLLVKWDDVEMNSSSYAAPLKFELKQKSEPLPPSTIKDSSSPNSGSANTVSDAIGTGQVPGEKKIPKWLQKGLLKKKT
ncbi:uncharacterized protein L203_105424 [Cryptococcus depauperatus CBS 7841]|uniref:Uncharacterized protein n=1 Tax=Cryptococcus depauperatus CBS 7841 TaxID=1295531 RepID=A0A1E3ID27_9TREE|nr:hypothetical protein L203_04100 [Cryptococcus depauperatus CBS 7841]